MAQESPLPSAAGDEMMDMVERVGRALAEADGYAYDPMPYDRWARAAIEAMRVPTDNMDMAGVEAEAFRSLGLLKVRHIWGAMINAALKP
jgi:hypothetical protein